MHTYCFMRIILNKPYQLKPLMKNLLTVVILLCSLNANAQVTRTITISVEPALSLQNYEHFKRFVLDSPDSHAEYVNGFEFEWGYYYKLSVKETDI